MIPEGVGEKGFHAKMADLLGTWKNLKLVTLFLIR
jgi:hypothetical protein